MTTQQLSTTRQEMATCALVRWFSDETVGVMPISAVQKGEKVYVGAVVNMKFKSKMYEAEILKLSSELSYHCAAQVFKYIICR